MNYLTKFIFMFILLFSYYIYKKKENPDQIEDIKKSSKRKTEFYEIFNKKNLLLNDVCGCDEAKIQINDILHIIKNAKDYKDIGARLPKGILLEGEPGVGKTMLVKALSSESNLPLILAYSSNFCDTYVGVGAKRVKQLFDIARKISPCIIFLDEIDAIGTKRNYDSSGGNNERMTTLNTILQEMDGFNELNDILIIAATNKADVLDSALTRSGRFDRKITIINPDLKTRKDLFNHYLGKVKCIDNVNLSNEFAKLTPSMTGADISNIVNEAALISVRDGYKKINRKTLNEAYEIHILGNKKIRGNLSNTELKIVAYHEAGHALLQYMLKYTPTVSRVSIEPRVKSALGYSQSEPDEKNLSNKQEMIHEISILLGGRIVEEIISNNLITTGAYDDLQKVNKHITKYIQIFGFDKSFGEYVILKNDNYLKKENCSDKMKYIIEKKCKKLIKIIKRKTKKIIIEHFDIIKNIANLLIKNKNIYTNDLNKIIGVDNKNNIIININ